MQNTNNNKVLAYLRYGINEMIRFYPEMITTIMPRLFMRRDDMSEADMLHILYSHKYKHGWAVTLNDPIFNDYYKMLTGVDHISINYNRELLYDEFSQKVMLCFSDIMSHKLEAASVTVNDNTKLLKFITDHEFDSDSIIDDILFEKATSNIAIHFSLENKYYLYEIMRELVCKFNEPAQNRKICSSNNKLNVDKCVYTKTIIDTFSLFNENNNFNV
eukprot:73226_1